MNLMPKLLLSFLALSFLTACGGGSSSGGGKSSSSGQEQQQEEVIMDGSNIEGSYVAELMPMNLNLDVLQVGSVMLKRENDAFSAIVKLDIGSPLTWHKQAIYLGNRCPVLEDDLNKDAYIDIVESQVAAGKVIIPLDGDLDSQAGARNQFPVGDEAGIYFYTQTASFDRMFADLKIPDDNTSDNIAKLSENQGLGLIGKVVIIQGTADTTFLPITVAGQGPHTPHQSIPVACGILKQVQQTPGDLSGGVTPTPTPRVTPTTPESPTTDEAPKPEEPRS